MLRCDMAPSPWGVVRDMSVTGFRIDTQHLLAVGTNVGLMLIWGDDEHESKARVVRHCEGGLAVAYVDPSTTFVNAISEAIEGSQRIVCAVPDYPERYHAEYG